MAPTNIQRGIADRAPEHVCVAALTFTPGQPAAAVLANLSELVRREYAADIDAIERDTAPGTVPSDAGELGTDTGYDTTNLTITLGISASGFTALGMTATQPADIFPIDWAQQADQPINPNSGDLVLQICADSAYLVEHVLRRIELTMAGQLSIIWTITGEQRNGASHRGQLAPGVARALIGFHDGLSNLDPDNSADAALIFCGQPGAPDLPPTPAPGPQPAPGPGQPGYNQPGQPEPSFPTSLRPTPGPEPAWAAGGTYMAVRATLMQTTAWDQQPLGGQQNAVGRYKYSGAALDNPNELAHQTDPPAFAANPALTAVPPNSHIRRANPRRPQSTDTNRRIFRRGYPLIVANNSGTLQRGLLFIAFGRTLSTQVDFIMKAWLKNPNFPVPNAGIDPLLNLEVQASPGISQVIAGGYYFVPPVSDPDQPWAWKLT
ncbi:MAG: Dyp-type peroxidase [Actinomycetota bacterium]|nr:Dyp-type peroxidase [Actinomycetota bacterium]